MTEVRMLNSQIYGVDIMYVKSGRKRMLCKQCFCTWAGIDETSVSTACEYPQDDLLYAKYEALTSGFCAKCHTNF